MKKKNQSILISNELMEIRRSPRIDAKAIVEEAIVKVSAPLYSPEEVIIKKEDTHQSISAQN